MRRLGGSSQPFQGKSQCFWPWSQRGQEEKQNISSSLMAWGTKELEVGLERGQRFGVVSEKESDGGIKD